jgi:hypothetical protein
VGGVEAPHGLMQYRINTWVGQGPGAGAWVEPGQGREGCGGGVTCARVHPHLGHTTPHHTTPHHTTPHHTTPHHTTPHHTTPHHTTPVPAYAVAWW